MDRQISEGDYVTLTSTHIFQYDDMTLEPAEFLVSIQPDGTLGLFDPEHPSIPLRVPDWRDQVDAVRTPDA